MGIQQAFKMAIRSVIDNKIRSLLTMLGVIIGVASVIILVSIVDSATDDILSTFDKVGTNTISLFLTGRAITNDIGIDEFTELTKKYPTYLKGVSPSINSSVLSKYGLENTSAKLLGTNEEYKNTLSMELQEGRFINEVDVSRISYVCVIGTYLQYELFGGANPVGENIKLNGKEFEVIGLLEETQSSSENGSDNIIIIPHTTAERFLKNPKINMYYFSAASFEVVTQAKAILENYLTSKSIDDDLYAIVDMSSVLDTLNDITGMLETLLGGIAAISLVVGGIGIMNIMLVTVTERTREIGVRKAIGAKRKSILVQFLIEAIVVSGCGGIIGILVGTGATIGIGKLINIPAVPTMGVILFSFVFSVAIGIFFGLYPASKASKLNPIDALRYQ